jgi:hypothetical protein
VTYLSHVLAVAATVWEYGGDEDLAIAGLLHDAIEDGGGPAMERRIREIFGDRVADVVVACSDSVVEDRAAKAPWSDRKVAYLAKWEGAAGDRHDDAALVSAADKLHNVRSLLADHRAVGSDLWERFSPEAGYGGTVWYYLRLGEVLGQRLARAGGRRGQLGSVLTDTIGEFVASVRGHDPDVDELVEARHRQEIARRATWS